MLEEQSIVSHGIEHTQRGRDILIGVVFTCCGGTAYAALFDILSCPQVGARGSLLFLGLKRNRQRNHGLDDIGENAVAIRASISDWPCRLPFWLGVCLAVGW